MSDQVQLPLSKDWGTTHQQFIPAPTLDSFTSHFGHAFPKPDFLQSELGATAVYDLPPPSGQSKRRVLFVHGLNTPALGMLPLSRALQAKDPDTHVVLFDLWGHGLSSTPLVAHSRQIFHHQVLQILAFKEWTGANIVGFSFGAVVAATFATQNPWIPLSVAILGPAGFMLLSDCSPEMQDHLRKPEGRESEAASIALEWLEGGPLTVPQGWKEDMASGHVIVAEALRKWELDEHQGYRRSVLSMVREGGIYDSHGLFRAFTKTGLRIAGIIGDEDDVCSKQDLVDAGFTEIHEVKGASHGFPRSHVKESTEFLHSFWQGL